MMTVIDNPEPKAKAPGAPRIAIEPARGLAPTRTTSRKRLLALLLLAAILGAAGALYWRLNRPGAAYELQLYGNVDIREVEPAFNDTGHVTRLFVQEGDRVKAGQLIATLDDTRYAAALAQAEGNMRDQQQVLAKLVAGSRPEEIAAAKATMAALGATVKNDEVNYRRAAALAQTGAGTMRQRDDARAALDTATQQYEASRQAYILAVKGPREEDIAAARAAYEADQGAVALARRELVDTRLYAPSDGIVEDRILEPGDMASPSTPVFTIALTSPLWVRAYVAETDLGKIALGMRAAATTDSFPGRVYHGWVGYIAPTAEFTPKTVETTELRTALVYQVRVYVCDARDELRLGMPASVQVDLRQKPANAAAPPLGCEPGDAAAK